MKLAKFLTPQNTVQVGVCQGTSVVALPAAAGSLREILSAADVSATVQHWLKLAGPTYPVNTVQFLAPIDDQEVWAAGVTYKRSQQARMDESEGAASFYDKVYSADRPELFFKATPSRVAGPGQPLRVRRDTRWTVPEPEWTLVLSPDLRIVGYTIGNDMSARDIEGENPLYLPQAKVYQQCAGLGPVIALADDFPPLHEVKISLEIVRGGKTVSQGRTSLASLNRKPAELVAWLGRDNVFPTGAFLMTGTGIVPDDNFTLEAGDTVTISIDGIGTLSNPIVQVTSG